MAVAKAASTLFLRAEASGTKLTGVAIIRAASIAVVLAWRIERFCFAMATTPTMERAIGFLATRLLRALMMAGSRVLTDVRIERLSASEMGWGTAFTWAVPLLMTLLRFKAWAWTARA